MSQTNIDRFDEIAGRVFADLYNSFPQPCFLQLNRYASDNDPYQFSDPVEGWVKREAKYDFAADAIRWLINAGFIEAGNRTGDAFPNAILTARGLESLKLTPNSLNSSAGKQLTEAAKNGSIEVIKGLTNQVLSVGVAIAAHKMGLQ